MLEKIREKINGMRRAKNRPAALYMNEAAFSECINTGYVTLDKCPEIISGFEKVAEMIATMTIYLRSNTEKGDIRIKNELSKKVDIYPYTLMTRTTWMQFIVMTMMLYGKGNAVVIPHTKNGLIQDLEPVPASKVSFSEIPGGGYKVGIEGKSYDPDDVLHFVYNPDKNYPWKGRGTETTLRAIAENLAQARATEKGFMESKWKPSLIIKVDSTAEALSSEDGREKLLEEYVQNNEAGKPWMLPAELFQIEQIKPLSLNDLAIADTVKLNKQTVASIIGVPAFVLGAGEFKEAEWNHFVSTKGRYIAEIIEQELTKKLILSEKWYFQFNISSLYSYDLKTTANIFLSASDRGFINGNEVRDKLGMDPKEGLEELRVLENYIPVDKSGDQKKLVQNDE